jgi:hypothetical protein
MHPLEGDEVDAHHEGAQRLGHLHPIGRLVVLQQAAQRALGGCGGAAAKGAQVLSQGKRREASHNAPQVQAVTVRGQCCAMKTERAL